MKEKGEKEMEITMNEARTVRNAALAIYKERKMNREERRLRVIYGPVVVCDNCTKPHHLRPEQGWVTPCVNPVEVGYQEGEGHDTQIILH